MSDVLQLADALRKLGDDELVRILRLRGPGAASLKDFFDLAEWLQQPKNLKLYTNSLPRKALDFLTGRHQFEADSLLTFLRDASLCNLDYQDAPELPAQAGVGDADSIAGTHAYETLVVIGEIVYELEHRLIKEVGRQGISIGDSKKLAQSCGKEPEYVRLAFELSATSGLIQSHDSRWVLTEKLFDWLEADNTARWKLLAETWLSLLGKLAVADIAEQLRAGSPLSGALKTVFPLEEFDRDSRFGHLIGYSELLGLAVDANVSSWTIELLENGVDAAGRLVAKSLPEAQDRIIIQSDLTVIAPGPLSVEAERQLRRFVDVEQAGLASRYRLSVMSLSFGIEQGEDIRQIRKTLERLSGKELPQPVDYILKETQKRYGLIRVMPSRAGAGAIVLCTEETKATELAKDSRLRPYNLVMVEKKALSSRLASDVVYFGLRENGYLAIRVASETPTGTITLPVRQSRTRGSGDWLEVLERLRQADKEIADSSDDESLTRQISLAIKTKTKLSVTFIGQNETEFTFVLEPTSLANGRMRARDRKADIERTIPLENIRSISVA